MNGTKTKEEATAMYALRGESEKVSHLNVTGVIDGIAKKLFLNIKEIISQRTHASASDAK